MRAVSCGLFAGLATVSLLACGGGADELRTPTTAATLPRPSPSATPAAGEPSVTVENAVSACREKDADMLRSLITVQATEAEVQALFARGSDVLLKRRSDAAVDGESATVDVSLEIHRDGDVETVERTWTLARGADGNWRLAALPDCY